MNALILIPSDNERRLFSRHTQPQLPADVSVRTCGVGLIASAAATATAVSQLKPDRVWLIGIGGSLNKRAEIGSALRASEVLQHGVGVGEADHFETSEQAGFSRFNHDVGLQTQDRINLQPGIETDSQSIAFLTVGAASSCKAEASRRCRMFPGVVVEDMESYSVALACRIANVPVVIIRGVSNVAGDRNVKNWDFTGAMKAAGDLLMESMK